MSKAVNVLSKSVELLLINCDRMKLADAISRQNVKLSANFTSRYILKVLAQVAVEKRGIILLRRRLPWNFARVESIKRELKKCYEI